MTAPEYFTLEGSDGVPPFIIALDDGTGGAGDDALCGYLRNDQENPPYPGEQPDAHDLNQTAYLAWAASVMMPKLTISVHWSGSAWSVTGFITPNRNIVLSDITVASGGGTGLSQVTVPTAKLPVSTMVPRAYPNDLDAAGASAVRDSAGVYLVQTWDASGHAAFDYSLEIFGY